MVQLPCHTAACHIIMCLQMAAEQSGSLVYKLDPLAPAHDVLKENDVVMEIDNVPIADDGTVEFRNEERVEFSHIVRAKHIGIISSAYSHQWPAKSTVLLFLLRDSAYWRIWRKRLSCNCSS